MYFTLIFFVDAPLHEKSLVGPSGAKCLNEWRIFTEKSKCYFALSPDGGAFEMGK